jgi:hypothetical protein
VSKTGSIAGPNPEDSFKMLPEALCDFARFAIMVLAGCICLLQNRVVLLRVMCSVRNLNQSGLSQPIQ